MSYALNCCCLMLTMRQNQNAVLWTAEVMNILLWLCATYPSCSSYLPWLPGAEKQQLLCWSHARAGCSAAKQMLICRAVKPRDGSRLHTRGVFCLVDLVGCLSHGGKGRPDQQPTTRKRRHPVSSSSHTFPFQVIWDLLQWSRVCGGHMKFHLT